MANNDEAGGSGVDKPFWKLSQEMEEQPHLYEDAAFPTDPETTDGTAEDDPTDMMNCIRKIGRASCRERVYLFV